MLAEGCRDSLVTPWPSWVLAVSPSHNWTLEVGSSAYSHSVFVVHHVSWDAGLGSDDVSLLSEPLPLIEN